MPPGAFPSPSLPVGGFTLDEAQATLLAPDGARVPLRPKTFALLRLLARHRGHVVERQQILDEVWAGLTVTDDNVTQCIGEIRRALGEEGGRLLRTVPRRGYLLAAEPAPPPQHATAAPPRRTARWAWVAVPVVLLAALGAGGWTTRQRLVEPAPLALAGGSGAEARALFDQGRAMAYRGQGGRADNWLTARRLFERAIAADPRFAQAYVEAAFTYTNMATSGLSTDPAGDLDSAAALVRDAVRLAPDLAVVRAAEGAVLRLQRRPAEALQAYREAVRLDPLQYPSRANAGLMLILVGRPQEAAEPVLEAMALAESNHSFTGTWLTYLGIAELQMGVGDFGAERFRRSLERQAFLAPDTRRLFLAAALALQGQAEAAGVLVREVLARQPAMTATRLRQAELSDDPAYLANQANLYRGLKLAGLPD